jgi:hypothetical protein
MEWVFVATILVMAAAVGLMAWRNAVVAQLSEGADSLSRLRPAVHSAPVSSPRW